MTTARDVIENLGFDSGDSEAILSALLSAPESVRLELAGKLNPWRPIETAPKDREILVFCSQPLVGEDYCFIARWSPEHTGWITWGGCELRLNITHWLPLPAPPSEDKP